MRLRLPVRLFASYTVVVVVGAAVTYLTVRQFAPHLFGQRIDKINHGGLMGGPGGPGAPMGRAVLANVQAAFHSALNTALITGLLAAVAVAAIVALVITRVLFRPLDAVRAATRQIAAGQYEVSVPLPPEPELAALADDVNTLAAALASTESRRTRLLGEVAHEMRTPLTSLDGYVEGLIDGIFTPDVDLLASLGEELRRLHRLADDLSSLSQAQEKRLELQPVDCDLADLARRAAQRLLPQFEDAQLNLVIDADASLPVHVDPDRIVQVLTNVLGNALLATPSGGTVTVTARSAASRAEIVITDTGEGLGDEDLERVFERFYRAPSQSRRSAGSGIGLTIARGIARAHGGDIVAASPGPGLGASFTLSVPFRT